MSSAQDSIRQSILQCIRDEKPSFADKLDETTLASEVEIDSIDIIQIVFKLEDLFQVSLDIDPSGRFERVSDMLDYLEGMIIKARRAPIQISQNG